MVPLRIVIITKTDPLKKSLPKFAQPGAGCLFLVSKEKEKLVPMFREKWKALPWMASAWQNSMHLE